MWALSPRHTSALQSYGSCSLPGLNRTMARRHPSSVLSICMSLIFDTSSVSTLQKNNTHKPTHTHQKSRVSNWYVHPAGISLETNAGGRPSVKLTNAAAWLYLECGFHKGKAAESARAGMPKQRSRCLRVTSGVGVSARGAARTPRDSVTPSPLSLFLPVRSRSDLLPLRLPPLPLPQLLLGE